MLFLICEILDKQRPQFVFFCPDVRFEGRADHRTLAVQLEGQLPLIRLLCYPHHGQHLEQQSHNVMRVAFSIKIRRLAPHWASAMTFAVGTPLNWKNGDDDDDNDIWHHPLVWIDQGTVTSNLRFLSSLSFSHICFGN